MTTLQKRKLIQMVMGFFLGRVSLFGVNPIGIALLASGYLETGIMLPLGISLIFGMITAFPLEQVVYYLSIMGAFLLIADFLEKRGIHMNRKQVMLVLLGVFVLFTGVRLIFFSYPAKERMFAVCLEGVIAVAFVRIFSEGQHFLFERNVGQYPDNEELLSLILFAMSFASGMPEISFHGISPGRFAIYFTILLSGYCYGVGAGALAGTIGGFGLLQQSESTEFIGLIALLGGLAGLLRNYHKWILCIGYFWGILIFSFFMGEGTFPYGDFVNVGLAGAAFFFVPEHIFGKAGIRGGSWEDYWESEKQQEMIHYKLAGISKVFIKMAGTLQSGEIFGGERRKNEVEEALAATSEQICGQCECVDNCGGHIALLRPDSLSGMKQSENGMLGLDQFPADFMEECDRQDYFVWEANQNLHMANLEHHFQNRIQYQQQVIAEQMYEVGKIMETLSENLPKIQKIPPAIREEIARELKGMRVKLEKLAFYERHDGRLEIYMSGRTSRGRCVTVREVELSLSKLLNRKMQVSEECRKVFPRDAEEFVFREEARLRIETGISRVSGKNETFSGDTFSCMELPGGEFLMALSDGMGSGQAAYEESEKVIELLEEMAEAGFSETASVKLINSLYISSEGNKSFTTADITLLNLYQKTAGFIKCGASTTYLYQNGILVRIEGEALPIGIMGGMEPYMANAMVTSGDYVIMMTDGVSDSYAKEPQVLDEILKELLDRRCGAKEASEWILEQAIEEWGGEPQDDMSVLVGKIY